MRGNTGDSAGRWGRWGGPLQYLLLTLVAVVLAYATVHWAIALVIFFGLVALGAWASTRGFGRKVLYLLLVTMVLWLGVVLHPLVMVFYVYPAITEALVIAAIAALVYARLQRRQTSRPRALPGFRLFMLLIIPLAVALGALGSAYTQEQIAAEISVNPIDTLPNLDYSQIRVLPGKVGLKYITDANQYPRLTPSDAHVVMLNGTPYWLSILSPEGFINSIILDAGGVAGVDATTLEKTSFVMEHNLSVAPGRFITNEPWYKAIEQDYWADYEYAYPVVYDGAVYVAVPKVTYTLGFRFPCLYAVPHWAGLVLFDGAGVATELTPQQAAVHPALAEQRLFPEYLARTYVDALNYRGGWVNVWLFHDGQFEIIDVSEQGNTQPFLIKTEGGLDWVFACKPYGEESQGLFEVFLMDARTGAVEELRLAGNALLGPVAAVGYVEKHLPLVDWGTMQTVEPIPLVINGSLYWEVRVVPYSGAGVAYIVAVDAASGNVSTFSTTDAFRAFVAGASPANQPQTAVQLIAEIQQLLALIDERLSVLANLTLG